jgi:hypothetical protein
MCKTVRLNFELLEDRCLMSAGVLLPPPRPVTVPTVKLTILPQAPLDILPGQQQVPIATMTVATSGHTFARLEEMLLVAAYGSEPLGWNVKDFILKADLNGKSKDGCEAVIGYAQADANDLVDFNIYRPVLTRPKPLRLEVDADFNSYLSGDQIGVEPAQAFFGTLRGDELPDDHVVYGGVDPVIHTMENHIAEMYQLAMNGDVALVVAGQRNISLLKFGTWSNTNVTATMSFVALQGSLQNATNYQLVNANYDGTVNQIISGTVANNQLIFTIGNQLNHGDSWTVYGDIQPADKLTKDLHLQLGFVTSPNGFSVTDLTTNLPMRGFILNGLGVGQVQMYAYPSQATVYTIQIPSITVTSPNGSESWIIGSTHDITWTSVAVATVYVAVESLPDSSGTYTSNILNDHVDAASGKYTWTVPSYLKPGKYRIVVYSELNGTVSDTSDDYFTITNAMMG